MGGAHYIGEDSWDSPFSWGGYVAYHCCTACGERLENASRGGCVVSGIRLCSDCGAALNLCPDERSECPECSGTGMSENKKRLCSRCGGFGDLVLGFMPPKLGIGLVRRIGPVAFTDLALFVPKYAEMVHPIVPKGYFGCPACSGRSVNGKWADPPNGAWPCDHMGEPFLCPRNYAFPAAHIFDREGQSRLCDLDCDPVRCPMQIAQVTEQRAATVAEMLPATPNTPDEEGRERG